MQGVKTSLDDFIKNVEKSIVKNVTFLLVDMYNSTGLKQSRAPATWVLEMGQFYNVCTTEIESQEGEVVKFLGDGLLVLFNDATNALNCAIKIQERLLKQRKESGYSGTNAKIGIATGTAYKITLQSDLSDYLGEVIDVAAKLCEKTRGNAITLAKATYSFAQTPLVESIAGRDAVRDEDAYFGKLASIPIGEKSIAYYNLHWGSERDYIVSEAMETPKNIVKKDVRHHEDKSEYGTVKRFQENNFGFISSKADKEDIFFGSRSLIVSKQSVVHPGSVVYYHRFQDNMHDGDTADSVVIIGDVIKGRIKHKFGERNFAFLNVLDHSGKSNLDAIFFPNDMNFDFDNDKIEGLEVEFRVGESAKGIHAQNICPVDSDKKTDKQERNA